MTQKSYRVAAIRSCRDGHPPGEPNGSDPVCSARPKLGRHTDRPRARCSHGDAEAQLNVSEDTARRLVGEQFPQWKKLALHEVPAAGTVNAIFRIGDEFAARFLLRAQDPTQARADLTAEAAAAGELANASTVPTPEPVAIGEPGHGYPLPWSIQ